MSNNNFVNFTCNISTNARNNPIQLEISHNNTIVFDKVIDGAIPVEFSIDDSPGHKAIRFTVHGKDDRHTKLDGDDILESTEIFITDLAFDGINIDNIVLKHPMEYTHDFNGYRSEVVEDFSAGQQSAGFNGTIELEFSSPVIVWILDKE